MSIVSELGHDFGNLPNIIAQYDYDLTDIEKNLSLKGKLLDVALKEQAAWPIYYDLRYAELKTLVKYFDAQQQKVRSTLFRKYENYSRALSERVTNTYIDSEDEYLSIHELYLEVEELCQKYGAAVDAFNKRGFALRDITASRIAKIEQSLL